jgi:glycerate kinase
MSLRVLVVPDKFKGTLTAQAAAELIAKGWREARPGDHLELLPMSDGGDGFGEVLGSLFPVEVRTVSTVDASRQPRQANWWWEPKSKTALIESAQVIGLALLPPGKYHPFELDTFGLGAVVQAALAVGAQRCLVGIGGSATNDAGFGLARSLGWTFRDNHQKAIEKWTELAALSQLLPPTSRGVWPEVLVGVDVQNPLLGPTGATRIYGPQKGLRPEDFPLAESCLERLAKIVEHDLRLAAAAEPGTGAAGGLGFGLRCFLNASLESGFNLFARYARLEERIRAAQLVITGEGAIDASTLMGKGVGEIASLCQKCGVPCLGLAGTLVELPTAASTPPKFTRVAGIAPRLTTPDEAKRDPGIWLPRLAAEAARTWC